MKTPTDPARRIASPKELRVLASPVKQEIVDVLASAGPCTIAHLGELLGRAPDGLYFHVRRLLATGLVVERSPRARGAGTASVLALPARAVALDYTRPASRAPIQKVVRAALRASERDFARACAERGAATEGLARTLWAGRQRGWLTPAQLREANRLLDELHALFRDGRPKTGARAMSFGFALAPCAPSKRAKPPRHR